MKKILLLGLLTFGFTCTTESFAQEEQEIVDEVTTTVDTDISEAERLIDKYSGEAYAIVKDMAQSLAVPAEHVWNVMVKQSRVDAIVFLILGIVASILIIICAIMLIKESSKSYEEERESIYAIFGLIGFISLIMLGISLGHLTTIVQGFVNPEYGAIERILTALAS